MKTPTPLATVFLTIFPLEEQPPESGLQAKLALNCTNGATFGPFPLDRDPDGESVVRCYESTPVIDSPFDPFKSRLMRTEECHEVERLAAIVLASLMGRAVKCGHGGWETGASSDASSSSSSLPMNPLLEGESPITIRHVADDIFEIPGGSKARFNDLTFLPDDDEFPDDDIFRTSRGQKVRIIHN